jgi:hypothetical protein
VERVFTLHRDLGAIEVELTSNPVQTDRARFNTAADRRVLVAQVNETAFNGRSGIASLPGLLKLPTKEAA